MRENILRRVEARKTDKEAWDTLETTYQGLDKVNHSKLQILRRYFESLLMKDTELVDSFCTRVAGMINQMKSHGDTIEDRRFVEKVLKKSLPVNLNPWS